MTRARSYASDRTTAATAIASRMAVIAVACAATLGLGACVPTELDRSTRPVNAFSVEELRMARDISYLPGNVALDPTGEAQLDAFLAQISPVADDAVTVVGYGPLGEARAQGAALALQARGIDRVQMAVAGQDRNTVTISVLRTVYQATACYQSADVREAAGGARLPTPGCVTDGNLARMVAQPSDLIHGRPTSPSEAGPAAAAVERYRAGAITALQQETTSQ